MKAHIQQLSLPWQQEEARLLLAANCCKLAPPWLSNDKAPDSLPGTDLERWVVANHTATKQFIELGGLELLGSSHLFAAQRVAVHMGTNRDFTLADGPCMLKHDVPDTAPSNRWTPALADCVNAYMDSIHGLAKAAMQQHDMLRGKRTDSDSPLLHQFRQHLKPTALFVALSLTKHVPGHSWTGMQQTVSTRIL